MTDVAVTDRLATGLARYAIRQWKEKVQAVARHVETVGVRTPTTGKGVRKLVREVRHAYEPNSFCTWALETKKGCAVACVVPGIEALDDVDHLSVEQVNWIFHLANHSHGSERLLAVHPHALARVFLRLQTVEFAHVRQELESTLVSWRALRHACERLQLAQIVVGTQSGVFRCDIRRGTGRNALPVAKTWIPFSTIGERDMAVVEDTAQAVIDWRATAPEKDVVHGLGLVGGVLPPAMVDALAASLERHAWLRTPYVERRDYLSEMWDAAREQARLADSEEPVPADADRQPGATSGPPGIEPEQERRDP